MSTWAVLDIIGVAIGVRVARRYWIECHGLPSRHQLRRIHRWWFAVQDAVAHLLRCPYCCAFWASLLAIVGAHAIYGSQTSGWHAFGAAGLAWAVWRLLGDESVLSPMYREIRAPADGRLLGVMSHPLEPTQIDRTPNDWWQSTQTIGDDHDRPPMPGSSIEDDLRAAYRKRKEQRTGKVDLDDYVETVALENDIVEQARRAQEEGY